MRAVVQRVRRSSVKVNGRTIGEIGRGLTVLVGVGRDDTEEDAQYLAEKIANLRIFEDSQGKMNLSLKEIGGSVLIVSQFTLYGDCRKGRRPSFDGAMPPGESRKLYEEFVREMRDSGLNVATGEFREVMEVEIINDGPVTLILDSKKAF
ncbi:MAG: D-aminoacyl-tRNA deacylase [bacterium]